MVLSNPLMVDPRVHKEAKALVDDGHEVTVIVWDRGHEYDHEKVVDGIRVVRIHNTGFMKLLHYDLLRNPLWWYEARKKAEELYKNGFDFDVVHCHDLDTLQVGVWLKDKYGVKLVYDAHELWGYLIAQELPNIVVKIAFYLEKKLVKNVNQVITVSPAFLEYFKTITDKPITLVMNCKDPRYKKYVTPKNKKFTLVYIGGMKKHRFFPEIVDIIGDMKDVQLILAGKIENLYYQMKEYCKKYSNIKFLGTIPTKDIIPKTRSADALFIIVDPASKHYQRTLFNKQFEAMVTGRPIIITKGTYAGKMTEELKCGITVEYNKESVKNTILKLRDNPKLCRELGENALKAALKKYNWEKEKKNLLKVYKEINK